MNTAETITAIVSTSGLVLAGLATAAWAKGWVTFSVSLSMRVVPPAKRAPAADTGPVTQPVPLTDRSAA